MAEAAGDGIETGRHAAAILGGTPGILHGSRSLMLQDRDGQVVEAVSASAGLDYPGVGPQLAALAEAGRISRRQRDRPRGRGGDEGGDADGGDPPRARDGPRDRRPAEAAGGGARRPGRARRRRAAAWPDETLVLVGFSGRGDKDLAALERFADVEPWEGVR